MARASAAAAYWGTPPPGGSYCTRATCLAHRRAAYVNLQEWAWVHADGWPCDGMAALTAEIQARRAARLAPNARQLESARPDTDPGACEDDALFTTEELTALGA